MAHSVFISHSAKNRDVADAICTALEKGGIRCWVAPRDVRPGRSFPGEITRAIQQSKVMLLIFSSHSNNSEQVLREVQLATDSQLSLIRFRIEDVSMNDDLKYFLSTPHWLDALTPPLSDHIARLELAIKELLGHSVEVSGKKVGDEVAANVAQTPASPPPPPLPTRPLSQPVFALAPTIPTVPNKPEKQRSLIPIVLAIAGAAILLCIIGAILLFLFRPPQGEQVTITASEATPPVQPTVAPASSPPRLTRVKQKSGSQTTRQQNAPATPNSTNDAEKSAGESAFDRAGALSLSKPEEETSRPKSAFDRAGGGIDSDDGSGDSGDASAEESPDEGNQ